MRFRRSNVFLFVFDWSVPDRLSQAKKMKQHAGKDGAAAKNALKRGAENGAAKKSATNGAAKNGTTNGAAKNGVAGATASASKDGKVSTEAQGAGARIGAKKEDGACVRSRWSSSASRWFSNI